MAQSQIVRRGNVKLVNLYTVEQVRIYCRHRAILYTMVHMRLVCWHRANLYTMVHVRLNCRHRATMLEVHVKLACDICTYANYNKQMCGFFYLDAWRVVGIKSPHSTARGSASTAPAAAASLHRTGASFPLADHATATSASRTSLPWRPFQ